MTTKIKIVALEVHSILQCKIAFSPVYLLCVGMDSLSIMIIVFNTIACTLAIVGAVLNVYTRKHPFNSFYRERLAICFSTVVFTLVSSVFRSPTQVDIGQIHTSVQSGKATIESALVAVGNWLLCSYYFGMHPTFNWCLIFMASLQTKRRQRKFEATDLSLLPSPTETNCKLHGASDEVKAVSTDTLALHSFNLQAIYPKPMKFISVFFIATGSAVTAGLLLAAIHAFHFLVVDRAGAISSNNKIPPLYKGLFTSESSSGNVRITFRMGLYSYSLLSTCARVIAISAFFIITALQLRNVKNPNKVTRKRSWIKLSLTFVIDIFPSLLTLLSTFIDRTFQSFTSLMLLLCATSSTMISFSIVPPCTILNERKINS